MSLLTRMHWNRDVERIHKKGTHELLCRHHTTPSHHHHFTSIKQHMNAKKQHLITNIEYEEVNDTHSLKERQKIKNKMKKTYIFLCVMYVWVSEWVYLFWNTDAHTFSKWNCRMNERKNEIVWGWKFVFLLIYFDYWESVRASGGNESKKERERVRCTLPQYILHSVYGILLCHTIKCFSIFFLSMLHSWFGVFNCLVCTMYILNTYPHTFLHYILYMMHTF